MHTDPVLYARGPYRVVTNTPAAPERLYVVTDGAGAWLRDEISFEAARDWVDRRIAEHEADGPAPVRVAFARTPRSP